MIPVPPEVDPFLETERFLEELRVKNDFPELMTPTLWNTEIILRPYQKVGVAHLVARKKMVLGDPCGTGKTPQAFYAWMVLNQQTPTKLIVITTRSAVGQWADEIRRFSPGMDHSNIIEAPSQAPGRAVTPEIRAAAFEKWRIKSPSSIYVMNWGQFQNDWPTMEKTVSSWGPNTVVVMDEFQKCKSGESKINSKAHEVSFAVSRVWGLTATVLKDRAHDVFQLMRVLDSDFMSFDRFEEDYAIIDRQVIRIPKFGRMVTIPINVVTGYKNLLEFKERMSYLYLGREDDELGIQRPAIIHETRRCRISGEQWRIYLETEAGLHTFNNTQDINHDLPFAAVLQLQLAVDVPEIFLPGLGKQNEPEKSPTFEARQKKNPKAALLKQLLSDELDGESVVIYSPLETTISQLMRIFKDKEPVRITGKESGDERNVARLKFQSGESKLLMITDAGGEALNLQIAHHLVMYSRPFDPGRYVQVVGRIRRFTSVSEWVKIWHLSVMGTLDEYLDALLVKKFGAFEILVGSRSGMLPSSEVTPYEIISSIRRQRKALTLKDAGHGVP